MARHQPSPECAPDCFGCKIQTISMSATGMPTRMPDAHQRGEWAKGAEKDMAAYARLRKEGLQPKGVVGAAAAEARGGTQFEVETGIRMHPELAQKVEDAQHFIKTELSAPLAAS